MQHASVNEKEKKKKPRLKHIISFTSLLAFSEKVCVDLTEFV